jgi:chemotaxis family two-component system sensor kinase Cph1
MRLQPGDHICSLYETDEELATTVAAFLAEGLARNERCWYVPSGGETESIRAAMRRRGVDVAAESRRSALFLLESNATYVQRGFDPEQTMRLFSDAIEQALGDGFNGFRAAADMSWALEIGDGTASLIAYEALLRMLFTSAPATGLCLYDRRRMPLQVVNGALLTHPVTEACGEFSRNGAYDPEVTALSDVDPLSEMPKRRRTRTAQRQMVR